MTENLTHSKLEQLKQVTTIVADTGDIDAIKRYQPVDATTNPSLLLKVCQQAGYRSFLDNAIAWSLKQGGDSETQLDNCIDYLAVSIGREILQMIPGRVSTEVSAGLSFNTQGTWEKARRLIGLYNDMGIGSDRVLIKIAATWEGIRAAEMLEREGIQCNLTLLFGFSQAMACADAGVHLISPFVGRILDWYKAKTGKPGYPAQEDPGVLSVTRIYHYYKLHSYPTVVMGASFRNKEQILALAGCDRLTISPPLLEALQTEQGPLDVPLRPDNATTADEKQSLTEQHFRWQLNQDAMAVEKLAEGIRHFHADEMKLKALIGATG